MTPWIRVATPRDGDAIADIYRPIVENTATSFELVAPDDAEVARRIERVTASTPWLVCEHGDAMLGYAYAGPFRERPAYRWSVEVSAYVRPEAHRFGIARALYTSLFELLVLQGFRQAFAGITVPNAASIGFHEALGFAHVGVFHGAGYKLGRWHDVVFLERPMGPRVIDPPEPRLLPTILQDPAFGAALTAGLPLLRVS